MRLASALAVLAGLSLWPAPAQAPSDPAAILGAAPSCHSPAAPPSPTADAPPTSAPGLFPGLGDTGFAVERVAGGPAGEAGVYFNEGLRLTNAFNQPEAIRAFQWSRHLDPACALCAWGEAWARGPTINYPISGGEIAKARAAAEDAGRLASGMSPKAQGLIAAMRARYPQRWGRPAVDNRAYARAMEALSTRFPDDDAVAVEAANALMIASEPHWELAATDPTSDPGRARALIDKVIARNPRFTPALHFDIHLSEGAGQAARAELSADRLAALAPGAGHLQHMPSHIYYRLGRFEDAATANARASADDARYVAELHPPGGLRDFALHAHNVSFGLAGALMSGDGEGALAFAHQAQTTFPPGSAVHARGYFAYARYAPAAEVLALPKPADPADEAIWRYARGEAHARQGDAAGVQAEADALAALQRSPAFASNPHGRSFVEIARLMLTGRAALLQGRWPAAIDALSKAADQRDRLDAWPDPPEWGAPPRRTLAAARLLSGDAVGAEREAQASLKHEPNDGLALHVLAEAQAKQDEPGAKASAASAIKAWRGDRGAFELRLI